MTFDDVKMTKLPQHPAGYLSLQVVTQPRDANASGDITAGWLLSQMDIAGAALACRVARGRVATVSTGSMNYLRSIPVGGVVMIYCDLLHIGRSSIRVLTEVWCNDGDRDDPHKITEGEFVFVAIDEDGHTRAIPPREDE